MQEQEIIYDGNGLPIESESIPDIPVTHRNVYYFYDDDFIFVSDHKELDMPEGETMPNTTTKRPPNGLYVARFNPQTQEWYESATREEIAEILTKGRYAEPTNEDLLMLQIADLYEENLQQQSFNDAVSMAIADLYERGLQ